MEEKRMRFVLNHYRDGLKSTEDALASVYEKAGVAGGTVRLTSWRKVLLPVAGIAASLLLVIFIGVREHYAWEEYCADASKAVVTLSDGTVMTLSPGTVAKVQVRVDPRHVELDGKAYFEVARDEARPFTVAAGEGTVKVLGTKFLVTEGPGGTSVDVTEGKVLFSAAGSEEGVVLTKGMSAALSGEMNIPTLVYDALPNPAAWATGEFVYRETSLGEALRELSSFYGVSLSTADEADPEQSFSGKFSTGSLDDIIYAIESALGVKIEKQ
ncbi:MAG: FecR family protein [Candidatus Cryptobacteroides sp.]